MALGKFAVSPIQAADASLLHELPRCMCTQVEPRWRAHKWLGLVCKWASLHIHRTPDLSINQRLFCIFLRRGLASWTRGDTWYFEKEMHVFP